MVSLGGAGFGVQFTRDEALCKATSVTSAAGQLGTRGLGAYHCDAVESKPVEARTLRPPSPRESSSENHRRAPTSAAGVRLLAMRLTVFPSVATVAQTAVCTAARSWPPP